MQRSKPDHAGGHDEGVRTIAAMSQMEREPCTTTQPGPHERQRGAAQTPRGAPARKRSDARLGFPAHALANAVGH
jgi:hypothetical protein